MAEVERIGGVGCGGIGPGGNFAALLANWIGTTVTIFTGSGGQSGSGFTGVLLSVNDVFVRLISRIGPAPGCALGNSCSNFSTGYDSYRCPNDCGNYGGGCGKGYGMGYGMNYVPGNVPGAELAGGWDGVPVYTVGSVVDIPIDSIVSFVHNAV